MSDKISESTVMRAAGNLLSGAQWTHLNPENKRKLAVEAVEMARLLASEVERTNPNRAENL